MNYELTIGWLYPELMSTYGDRGNIICLTRRCFWRGIFPTVIPIDTTTTLTKLAKCDLIFGGGAQDRQQEIVMRDLIKKKDALRKMFEKDVPGLFVCGAPQLLGHYYETATGTKLPGLGIFDMYTANPGPDAPRCIGNLVAEIQDPKLKIQRKEKTIVGFENHGGRTYLGNVQPFAKVIKGFGNNGQDKTEGAIFHNCIATYSHGPFLPKNPHIADWLIKTALEVKYRREVKLKLLDDALEWQAHNFVLKKYG